MPLMSCIRATVPFVGQFSLSQALSSRLFLYIPPWLCSWHSHLLPLILHSENRICVLCIASYRNTHSTVGRKLSVLLILLLFIIVVIVLLILLLFIIVIIIIIEFLTSQLWLGNIHLSWDVVISRIRLGGLICSLKSFLQLNMCQELQIFAVVYIYWGAS